MSRLWAAPLVAALLAGGCGVEDPTEVGGGLLPSGVIRTFEVVLEPARYLVADTAFGLYSEPVNADFMILATGYQDAFDSRILARFRLPTTVSVPDSQGVTRTDSMPVFFAGEVLLAVDTTGASTEPPSSLALFLDTEDWDDASATWTLRVDTPGARLPWVTPGGSPGALVGTASYTADSDTVRLPVDSATLAIWRDTMNARGAVITVQTQGARLRTSIPLLRLEARASFRPDTVVTATVQALDRTFIFQPEQPDSAAAPRVGGTPAWRTFVRLRDRLDTLTVACPGPGDPNCRVRLSEVQINRAALLLQPVPSPAGFDPEKDIQVTAHFVLSTPTVPLHRSPLTDPLSLSESIPRSSFLTAGGPIVELGVTDLILTVVREPTDTTTFRPSYFALLPAGTRTFGIGTFAELPALRLVISVARELQLP